uniref:Uncharacterized protein n=1 Tax=Setaria italica TaxID=4555 RepID=K3ZFX6_SETIT
MGYGIPTKPIGNRQRSLLCKRTTKKTTFPL